MKKLKLWAGKAWWFIRDDRVGLILSGCLLFSAFTALVRGQLEWAAWNFAFATFGIWLAWRGLAEKAEAVRQ
ncbi:hypothetical protein K32_48590 [Kaistia sp. 32K]|uniref:hypothetical protein n=1 Tax=Kaistia sp. 32K TaxID=2795690 RepID=UPI001916989D|nr:hypothetical protein [Kaistia sp. 32K]BCP56242.1 hypothetical protein K32_48590 [Kaistia sp. 32K]